MIEGIYFSRVDKAPETIKEHAKLPLTRDDLKAWTIPI